MAATAATSTSTVDGTIITHGDNAAGIFAQSVGGGGGVLGELGNDLPVLNLLSWAIGSNGDAGDAGQVDVTLTGSIMTVRQQRDRHLRAERGRDRRTAGDVNVTLNSSIVTGAMLAAEDGTRKRRCAASARSASSPRASPAITPTTATSPSTSTTATASSAAGAATCSTPRTSLYRRRHLGPGRQDQHHHQPWPRHDPRRRRRRLRHIRHRQRRHASRRRRDRRQFRHGDRLVRPRRRRQRLYQRDRLLPELRRIRLCRLRLRRDATSS